MEWLTSLLGGGMNIMSGGLIGAVGGVVTGWLKLKERKADQEHERLMRDKDRELLLAEADSAVKLEQARAVTAAEQGAADAFTASQVNARVDIPAGIADKVSPWVANTFVLGEFAKGMVRIVLTILSFAFVVYFGFQGIAEASKDGKLALTCVKSVIFMAELSGGWWFAQRQMGK
jgi:hypothetical protein